MTERKHLTLPEQKDYTGPDGKTYRIDSRQQWCKIYGKDNLVPSPLHCGIDTIVAMHLRVNGHVPSQSDLFEVGAVVCDDTFSRVEDLHFQVAMAPRFNPTVSSLLARRNHLLQDDVKALALRTAATYDSGALMFEEWTKKFLTNNNARLHIICMDDGIVKPWLMDWLGPLYGVLIRDKYRSVRATAQALMDFCHLNRKEVPPLHRLSTTATQTALEVHVAQPGDSLHEAVAVLDCYRSLLRRF